MVSFGWTNSPNNANNNKQGSMQKAVLIMSMFNNITGDDLWFDQKAQPNVKEWGAYPVFYST